MLHEAAEAESVLLLVNPDFVHSDNRVVRPLQGFCVGEVLQATCLDVAHTYGVRIL